MKYLTLGLLAVMAIASASNFTLQDSINLEDNTAYGYLSKVGRTLAERIRKTEEEASQNINDGGNTSIAGQLPYLAGLIVDIGTFQAVCFGSLITSTRVLTAAHCWYDGIQKASRMIVVLEFVNLFKGGTRLVSSDVVMHENWNPLRISNDIAIITLSPVAQSNKIAFIALPSGSQLNENFAGDNAVASGFGRTADGMVNTTTKLGILPTIVFQNHTTLSVISNSLCSLIYGAIIQPSNICTTGGICNVGTGGPLVAKSNNQDILIGVSSLISTNGCEIGAPTVYTRVSSYINWINQHGSE